MKKTGMDIYKLNTVDYAKRCYAPALISFAKDDDFVAPSHGVKIAANYAGDNNYVEVDGDHNTI